MADEDSPPQHAPETSASTPTSSAAAQNGPKAPKDRHCPFCSQPFTSSSLGRHLDLYIKPKNPKPADGVHDVDEIRKIRGGITRRQPRTSLKNSTGDRREISSTPSVQPNGPRKVDVRMTEGSPMVSPVNVRDDERVHTFINAANWQATGVINNLPPRVPSRANNPTPTGQAQRIQEMRRDATGQRQERPESESWYKMQEAAETGRAAELALRELLGSLEAARKRTEPEKLFDFDFFTLTFPALCLAILPAPSTLFSNTPFPGGCSWPINPPGQKQFEALNRKMQERIAQLRALDTEIPSLTDVFKYNQHLQAAYEHWSQMHAKDQATAWQLDVLRAFARADERVKAKDTELEVAKQQVRYLEAQYDRLSKCQLPREYLLHPPNVLPIPPAMAREVTGTLAKFGDNNSWDPEVMLSKWKAAGRITQRAPTKPSSVVKSPSTPADMGTPKARDDLTVHNISSHMVNGPTRNEGCGRWAQTQGMEQQPSGNTQAEEHSAAQANGGANEDEDADADAEEETGHFSTYLDRNALHRQQQFLQDAKHASPVSSNSPAAINNNGKRPLAPAPINGREKGMKIYREDPIPDGGGHPVYQQGALETGIDSVDGYGARR